MSTKGTGTSNTLEGMGDAFLAASSVFAYGAVVIGKTLLTKMCFSSYSFDYPITFSLFSCLTTMVACGGIFVMGQAQYTNLPRHHWRGFAQIAVLTAMDMGFTNWSLDLITVAFQLTIKAAIPAIVVSWERFVLGKSHTSMAYLSLSPLIIGAVLVGLGSGSQEFNLTGTILMVIATFASSIKMVTTHSVIRQVRDEMGMVSFLFWLELSMVPILTPWAWLNGELSTVASWDEYNEPMAWTFILVVAVIGGLRAYVQNMVLKYNSALTLAAANILIQALTILISIWVFNTSTTTEMDLGIAVSLGGYALYTMQKTMSKKKSTNTKAATASPSPYVEVDVEKSDGTRLTQESSPLLNEK